MTTATACATVRMQSATTANASTRSLAPFTDADRTRVQPLDPRQAYASNSRPPQETTLD